MALSLRQIKRRIRSVDNTKKITKAMEMIAASKLKKYQDLLGQTRAYAARLERMLGNLISSSPSVKHPFFEVREPKKTTAFLITSDSGLCGSYNYNLFQTTEDFLVNHEESPSFFSIGRQGLGFLRRKQMKVVNEVGIPRPQEIPAVLKTIIDHAKQSFLEGKADQIFLIYTEFISLAVYKPKVEKILPLEGLQVESELPAAAGEYIFEPSLDRILEEMIPHYLELKIEQALKGALVSEQVSRMMAMRQATDNASEMIDSLTLQRNKARQASITKELIEVVSGSRALQTK